MRPENERRRKRHAIKRRSHEEDVYPRTILSNLQGMMVDAQRRIEARKHHREILLEGFYKNLAASFNSAPFTADGFKKLVKEFDELPAGQERVSELRKFFEHYANLLQEFEIEEYGEPHQYHMRGTAGIRVQPEVERLLDLILTYRVTAHTEYGKMEPGQLNVLLSKETKSILHDLSVSRFTPQHHSHKASMSALGLEDIFSAVGDGSLNLKPQTKSIPPLHTAP